MASTATAAWTRLWASTPIVSMLSSCLVEPTATARRTGQDSRGSRPDGLLSGHGPALLSGDATSQMQGIAPVIPWVSAPPAHPSILTESHPDARRDLVARSIVAGSTRTRSLLASG